MMGEPLQCLPQQPLKGPCGERLVLYSHANGSATTEHLSFDNIANE